MSHDEITQILLNVQPGDVGVHCDKGFLSNLFIPGAFKHAWLFKDQATVIEAVHLGVVERSARYSMRTDDLVILRPKFIDAGRQEAVDRALQVVGFQYDVEFEFDLNQEFNHLNRHDQAFSCIELVAYSYYPYFDALGFKWEEHLGKEVLFPGVVINPAWDVVYSNVPGIPVTIK